MLPGRRLLQGANPKGDSAQAPQLGCSIARTVFQNSPRLHDKPNRLDPHLFAAIESRCKKLCCVNSELLIRSIPCEDCMGDF